MKKLILLLTVFAFALTANVFAQESADVAVNAEVQADLALQATAVEFGIIEQATSTLAANSNDGDGSSTNVGTGATPGTLTIAGSEGSGVQITFGTATLVVENGDSNTPADIITFTPTLYFDALQINSGDSFGLAASTTIDIGGTLSEPQQTGSFSTGNGGSPLTVQVQYTTL